MTTALDFGRRMGKARPFIAKKKTRLASWEHAWMVTPRGVVHGEQCCVIASTADHKLVMTATGFSVVDKVEIEDFHPCLIWLSKSQRPRVKFHIYASLISDARWRELDVQLEQFRSRDGVY